MQDQPTGIPYGHCHCGCGERTKIASYNCKRDKMAKGEPLRYIPGHQRRSSPLAYIVDPVTGCWVWQRSKDKDGYGRAHANGRGYRAHRVEYEKVHGPIPDGMQIDHLCLNKSCVNPAHLEVVTTVENTRRRRSNTLRADDVVEIRAAVMRGESRKDLAARFGVTVDHVGQIVSGRRWAP